MLGLHGCLGKQAVLKHRYEQKVLRCSEMTDDTSAVSGLIVPSIYIYIFFLTIKNRNRCRYLSLSVAA